MPAVQLVPAKKVAHNQWSRGAAAPFWFDNLLYVEPARLQVAGSAGTDAASLMHLIDDAPDRFTAIFEASDAVLTKIIAADAMSRDRFARLTVWAPRRIEGDVGYHNEVRYIHGLGFLRRAKAVYAVGGILTVHVTTDQGGNKAHAQVWPVTIRTGFEILVEAPDRQQLEASITE